MASYADDAMGLTPVDVERLREWRRAHGDQPPFRLALTEGVTNTPAVQAWLREAESRVYRNLLLACGIEVLQHVGKPLGEAGEAPLCDRVVVEVMGRSLRCDLPRGHKSPCRGVE